jgi:hypothetical protein
MSKVIDFLLHRRHFLNGDGEFSIQFLDPRGGRAQIAAHLGQLRAAGEDRLVFLGIETALYRGLGTASSSTVRTLRSPVGTPYEWVCESRIYRQSWRISAPLSP